MIYIKMGSDESHFNVSLIVRDKVTRQCPQTTTFEEKEELKRYRTEVLPLHKKIIKKMTCLLGRIVQEVCESRGGRPGLSVLTSLPWT